MIDFVYRQIHQSRIRKATNIQVNQKNENKQNLEHFRDARSISYVIYVM